MYKDRKDAGQKLAARLTSNYKDRKDVIVLGLARGGMVVASLVAGPLHLPLNVLVVRKIGAPGNSELALGAISEHGASIFNEQLMRVMGLSIKDLESEIEKQKQILKQRLDLYRGTNSSLHLEGKTVILVDDGIATGASMRVAIASAKQGGAEAIVVAVPVAAPDSLAKIAKETEEVVCLLKPVNFEGVSSFYESFEQTRDEEVVALLHS